jgi:uncharacterized phage infection (PIP) family protein YhgE
MHPVDELLRDARRVLGDLTPPGLPVVTTSPPPAPPASWSSDTADAAQTTSSELNQQLTHLHELYAAARAVLDEAATVTNRAHTELHVIEQAWAADQTAADPHQLDGQAALLHTGRDHVTAITETIRTAADRFQQLAQQLATITAELPAAGAIRPTP